MNTTDECVQALRELVPTEGLADVTMQAQDNAVRALGARTGAAPDMLARWVRVLADVCEMGLLPDANGNEASLVLADAMGITLTDSYRKA